MVTNSRDEWERAFNICWGGVYNCTRAFLPMLPERARHLDKLTLLASVTRRMSA
jgi:NAD(P)-dependent dehydrogenase (short-subunit alcohol dehydrogenase family)